MVLTLGGQRTAIASLKSDTIADVPHAKSTAGSVLSTETRYKILSREKYLCLVLHYLIAGKNLRVPSCQTASTGSADGQGVRTSSRCDVSDKKHVLFSCASHSECAKETVKIFADDSVSAAIEWHTLFCLPRRIHRKI